MKKLTKIKLGKLNRMTHKKQSRTTEWNRPESSEIKHNQTEQNKTSAGPYCCIPLLFY